MLKEFFDERLSKLLGLPVESIGKSQVETFLKNKAEDLRHLDQARIGGHISSMYLTHFDDSDFAEVKSEAERFVARITRPKLECGRKSRRRSVEQN